MTKPFCIWTALQMEQYVWRPQTHELLWTQVSQGISALTCWVLVHFFFIFGAIVVYGSQLVILRLRHVFLCNSVICNLRSKGYLLYVSPFVGSVTDQKPFTLWCATISLRVLDIHSRIWKYLLLPTLIQNVLDVCRGRCWLTMGSFFFHSLKKL